MISNLDQHDMSSASSITFNYQIVDGHIEIPYCRQLFDKSDEQSTQLETPVT